MHSLTLALALAPLPFALAMVLVYVAHVRERRRLLARLAHLEQSLAQSSWDLRIARHRIEWFTNHMQEQANAN